jgi:hypothetical protein
MNRIQFFFYHIFFNMLFGIFYLPNLTIPVSTEIIYARALRSNERRRVVFIFGIRVASFTCMSD